MSIRPVSGPCTILRSAAVGWYVEHPKNCTILAYADTRDEAEAFAQAYDHFMGHFDTPTRSTDGEESTPIDNLSDPPTGPYLSWLIRFEVHPTWVADGFDLTKTRCLKMLSNALPDAYDHELSAIVVATPHPSRIKELQGETK